MHAPQLIAVLVASGTWVGFASIKSYFRYANRRTPAKTGLMVSAFICTVVQVIAMIRARPASPVWFWLGIAGYGVANCLFWRALAAHGKSHPAFAFIRVAPASLTTAGPYRLVRHPIYTAYLLTWCAGAAICAQPWLLLTVGCMGVFYGSAAHQEEKTFLASGFGPAYQAYRGRTGMFFPKLSGLGLGWVSRARSKKPISSLTIKNHG
jgi:protein-S-isoprenylcysteine O-methyltransferase Ste14